MNSLFDDVRKGAETGAVVGKRITGIAGTVAGWITGATAGCFHWLINFTLNQLTSGK